MGSRHLRLIQVCEGYSRIYRPAKFDEGFLLLFCNCVYLLNRICRSVVSLSCLVQPVHPKMIRPCNPQAADITHYSLKYSFVTKWNNVRRKVDYFRAASHTLTHLECARRLIHLGRNRFPAYKRLRANLMNTEYHENNLADQGSALKMF